MKRIKIRTEEHIQGNEVPYVSYETIDREELSADHTYGVLSVYEHFKSPGKQMLDGSLVSALRIRTYSPSYWKWYTIEEIEG